MADLQDYRVSVLSAVTVNVPRLRIEARITDSQTGATLRDYTGANAITFPADLQTLLTTPEDRRVFGEYIAAFLIQKRRELDGG
jgi:hypothetical protein